MLLPGQEVCVKYRGDRFPCDLPVKAKMEDAPLGEGRLCNISATGAMVSGVFLERGAGLVTLSIGREALTARVTRTTDTGTAFAFARPLGRADLAKLRLVQSRGAPVLARGLQSAGHHGFREMR
jgi:hypothetical protein